MAQVQLNTYLGTLHKYLTYFLFFALSMPDKIMPLAIVLWSSSWLLWRVANYKQRYPLSENMKVAALLFAIFTLYNFASAFWGATPSLGGRIMESRLAFVLLSLMLLAGMYPDHSFRKIIRSYFLGALCSLLIYLISFSVDYAFADGFKYQIDAIGFGNLISDYKHPAYFTLNLILSFFLYLTTLKKVSKLQILSLAVYYLTLYIFVYISGSRTGLINMTILSGVLLFFLGRRYLGLRKILLISIPLVAILAFGVLNSTKFQNIFDQSEHTSIRSPRRLLWSSAVEVVKEKPIFGHGLGSSASHFIDYCQEHTIYNATVRKLNAHNQYLEYLMESGLLGLLIFSLSIFYLIKSLDGQNRKIALGILCILFCSLFFESVLLRIAGIATFTAMFFLLAVVSKEKTSVADDKQSGLYTVLMCAVLLLFVAMLCMMFHSQSLLFEADNPDTYVSKNYVKLSKADLPLALPQDLSNQELDVCKFDANSKPSLWSGNAYMLNQIAKQKIEKDEQLTFSAYCYVSHDFDGSWVRISIDKEGMPPIAKSHYNMKQKGNWQKLELTVDNQAGEMPAYLYFCKSNTNSFEDLKGYVLYAYPQYIITKK